MSRREIARGYQKMRPASKNPLSVSFHHNIGEWQNVDIIII
jgi:hypothetical protein